jgi:hypothetical protein
MKKTIIALMALAGAAAAATEEVNTITAAWGTAPVVAGNCWSADYTLTFTLDALYTLEESGSVLGFYRGSAVNDTYGYNAIVLGGSNDALTLTVGRGRANNTVDNATGINAGTTFSFQDNVTFTTAIQKGVTYTLSVAGANQAMTPTLTWDGGSETLDSYNGNMNGDATITSALNPGTITVPEPTTATLSLLALAGLAARRRRK